MTRRIFSGGEFEAKIGYCRAVVAGGFVQCRAALATIEGALREAGCTMADVVRVNYYLPDRAEFEPCWPILSEVFGDAPPAATMIECGLIDDKYRIEIEVIACLPG